MTTPLTREDLTRERAALETMLVHTLGRSVHLREALKSSIARIDLLLALSDAQRWVLRVIFEGRAHGAEGENNAEAARVWRCVADLVARSA